MLFKAIVINELLEIRLHRSSENMATSSNKGPPSLSKSKSYEDWLKLMKIWKMYTGLPKSH